MVNSQDWGLVFVDTLEARNRKLINGVSVNEFVSEENYAWVRNLRDIEPADLIPKDICSLQRLFFNSEAGKTFLDECE